MFFRKVRAHSEMECPEIATVFIASSPHRLPQRNAGWTGVFLPLTLFEHRVACTTRAVTIDAPSKDCLGTLAVYEGRLKAVAGTTEALPSCVHKRGHVARTSPRDLC